MSKKVLVLSPHNDDETLGCGATIARHIKSGDEVYVAILTSISKDHPVFESNKESVRQETAEAMRILGVKKENIIFEDLPNLLVPDLPVYEVNAVVKKVIFNIEPEIMYIPFMYDLHKDHRDIAYAAQVAARTCTQTGRNIKKVYMYETLSETHWNVTQVERSFEPNVFNDITDFMDLKLQAIKAYKSQLKSFPDARSIEALNSLALLRGSIVGMRYAEAFVLVREFMS